MRFLFAAGDVGGARALLPVARLAAAEGVTVMGLAHGVFHTEGDAQWIWLSPDEAARKARSSDVILYATSVTDPLSVEIAQAAQAKGRPVLHLLDNWSNYAARIASLIPDVYAVMDTLAFEEAIADGVSRDRLVITGHPDLAKLPQELDRLGISKVSAGKPSLFFVSEPAAADGGKEGRGYNEAEVARALMQGIAAALGPGHALTLNVAPHPREDRTAVTARFAALSAEIRGAPRVVITAPGEVRRTLHAASHVAGMSSILLYQSWLLGRATLSLQPGLTGTGLRSLSQRDGVIYHTSRQGTVRAVEAWLARQPRAPRPDLRLHATAARNVFDLARNLAANAARPPRFTSER